MVVTRPIWPVGRLRRLRLYPLSTSVCLSPFVALSVRLVTAPICPGRARAGLIGPAWRLRRSSPTSLSLSLLLSRPLGQARNGADLFRPVQCRRRVLLRIQPISARNSQKRPRRKLARAIGQANSTLNTLPLRRPVSISQHGHDVRYFENFGQPQHFVY
jgi:hypothetical protein